MMPNPDRKLNCIRLALYFNDGNYTVTKSPQKDVKIGTRTKLGWWICLIGAWLIFGKANDFRTVINPLWPEPPKDEAERTCFTCANALVDDNDCIICVIDGRSRDDDQTCDEWIEGGR